MYYKNMFKKSKLLMKQSSTWTTRRSKREKPLPPDHHQLLFLIDIFNNNNKIITTNTALIQLMKTQTYPQNLFWVFFHFILDFYNINKRIDLKQLLGFNNWIISLYFRFWSGDVVGSNLKRWLRALVEHADNFNVKRCG